MENQIVCPNCKKVVPITEAISHEIREKIQSEFAQKEIELKKQGEAEIEKVRMKARKWQEDQQRIWTEQQKEQEKTLEQKLKQKIQAEMDDKLKDTQNESEELKTQLAKRREEELQMRKQLREMKQRDEEREIEMAKKLATEQERIRVEAEEDSRLKMAEKDKKIDDALKLVDEYKRKLEQGSQQAQGEVLELDIEQKLRQAFPGDDIKEVPKGIRGADLIQIVKNRQGEVCGTVVWEFKRTKAWSSEFIPKLKDDQRQLKAEIAALISDVLPSDVSIFGVKDGVWIGNYQIIVSLAYLLRKSLLEVAAVKNSSIGRKEKMAELWEYLTSVGFKQRIEVIVETFSAMQQEIEKERRWFNNKWEKQDKILRKVIDNTAGMYGGLQQIMGKSLPRVNEFEVEEVEVEVEVGSPVQIESTSEDDATTLF